MKINPASILLMALVVQISTAYNYPYRIPQPAEIVESEKWRDELQGQMQRPFQERAWANFNFQTLKGVTIFAKNNRLEVYSGNRPGGGQAPIATLTMGSLKSVNGEKTLAFDPRYTRNGVVQGSAYFFNMGRLLNVGHGESCTLFEAETDYPLATPHRSIGADTIGNHAGLEIFGESRAVFWILYDQANYIVPHSGEYDYEAHIVCTEI